MVRKALDTENEYLGKESTIAIGEIGRGDIEVVDKPLPTDAIDMEKFMNEPVTVMVYEARDETETDLVYTAVNGVAQYIRRGIPQTIKRKYVEVLARAKPTSFTQNLDDRLGEAMNHLRQRHGLKYPFTVQHDPNPNGAPWLRGVLAEA